MRGQAAGTSPHALGHLLRDHGAWRLGPLLWTALYMQRLPVDMYVPLAYSRFVHSFHACRDRVVLLPLCILYGAATLRPPPLGPGRGLTLPCGWNNAGTAWASAPS